MRNKLALSLVGFAIVHCVIAAFLFQATKTPLVFMGIVSGVVVIGFGSYLALLKPKSDTSGTTQQYIVATTIQILAALGFVLFARFADPNSFKVVAFHFLAAFFGALVIQSAFLIQFLNKR